MMTPLALAVRLRPDPPLAPMEHETCLSIPSDLECYNPPRPGHEFIQGQEKGQSERTTHNRLSAS